MATFYLCIYDYVPPVDEMTKEKNVSKNFGWKNRNLGLKRIIRKFGSNFLDWTFFPPKPRVKSPPIGYSAKELGCTRIAKVTQRVEVSPMHATNYNIVAFAQNITSSKRFPWGAEDAY